MREFASELLKTTFATALAVRLGQLEQELATLERAEPGDPEGQTQRQQRENLARMEAHEIGGFVQEARDEHPELAMAVARKLTPNPQAVSVSELLEDVAQARAVVEQELGDAGVNTEALVQSGVSPDLLLERGRVAVAFLSVREALEAQEQARTPEEKVTAEALGEEAIAFARKHINTGTAGLTGEALRAARGGGGDEVVEGVGHGN